MPELFYFANIVSNKLIATFLGRLLDSATKATLPKEIQMSKKNILAAAFVAAIGFGAYWYAKSPDDSISVPANPSSAEVVKDSPSVPVEPGSNSADRSDPPTVVMTLESSEDYSLLLAQQLPLAEAGDATAMGTVAKVLEYCQLYSASPANFESHVQGLAALDPSQDQALKRVAAKVAKRCGMVTASPSVAEAMQSWLSQAAEAGDVSALVRTAVLHYEGTSPQERAALIQVAMSSEDANVMFEAGALLPFGVDGETADFPVSNREIDRLAWEIAACRRGAACGAGQNLMDAHCVSGSGCNAVGYEDLVRREFVPQGSTDLLDKKVREILQYVGKNNQGDQHD